MISIQARKLVKVSIIMIATRSIKIENVTVEQNTAAATMFGANTLQSVNTSDSGVPFAQYETAITVAGVTNLRFPGGTGEVLNNLLVGSTRWCIGPWSGGGFGLGQRKKCTRTRSGRDIGFANQNGLYHCRGLWFRKKPSEQLSRIGRCNRSRDRMAIASGSSTSPRFRYRAAWSKLSRTASGFTK